MLEGPDAQTLDTPPAGNAVQVLRDLIQRMQAEIKFEKTRNEALNLEIARLKRWRFGSSSESLDSSTQAVLFDAILADTALEDRAAEGEIKPASVAPAPKRQAVRQALPASLPRIERHHETLQTCRRTCGVRLAPLVDALDWRLPAWQAGAAASEGADEPPQH